MSFFNTKSDNVDDRQEDKDVAEEINMTEDLMTYNNYGDFDVDVGVDFNIGNDEQYDVAVSEGGFFGKSHIVHIIVNYILRYFLFPILQDIYRKKHKNYLKEIQ